jgi:purine nucleosidase
MKDHKQDVVLDTDTFNEIDDQFALAYLQRASDRLNLKAIYAAPFHNDRSSSAGDGMRKSYEEIERLLERLEVPETPHFMGSDQFLSRKDTPVASGAVDDLLERSKGYSQEDPLVIIVIGALTNIASALLFDPTIATRTHLYWLGGHLPGWPVTYEFNLCGDIKATQVVFDSKIPMHLMPCEPVSSHLSSTVCELERYLSHDDRLCKFLYARFCDYLPGSFGVKEIWDVAPVAWLTLPETIQSYSIARPRVSEDGSYIMDPRRGQIEVAFRLDRDAIFSDMFERLNPKGKRG